MDVEPDRRCHFDIILHKDLFSREWLRLSSDAEWIAETALRLVGWPTLSSKERAEADLG
ncbi:hypothetical protein ACFOD4_10820 [Pseudoroseomonas globiformis]|uniref:Uncharacterized protein n=1 Tax=Teichococcus globiformis TaxID=2307229 RepID=A0ABV7G243_9PROT